MHDLTLMLFAADVDNKWAIPSCTGGNCLRSHVNKTETLNALVMLTKAGVQSSQIMVGVSSYGRSFRMQDENCSGPFCTFAGGRGQSQAYKGRCTGTGGYIANAELNEIIGNHGGFSIVKSFVDSTSNSNILMYGNPGAVDWVAYMDGDTKADRVNWIKQQNFGGFSDWAIDLESFTGDDTNPGTDDDDEPDFADLSDDDDSATTCGTNPGSLQSISDSLDNLSRRCASLFTLDVLATMIDDSLVLFDENNKDYDTKFGYYEKWVKENIDAKLDNFTEFGRGEGNQFFKCNWKAGKRTGSGPCTAVPHFWDEETTFEVDFELVDENGFYAAASDKLGIDRDWIAFGNRDKDYECRSTVNEATQRRPGMGNTGAPPPCSRYYMKRHNVPIKADDSKIKIPSPKEMIVNILPNITSLRETMVTTSALVNLGIYDDTQDETDVMDAVVGYSMPVLQLSESVDSMKTVKDIGERAHDEDKRNLIMKIISYVLMALPFVGEAIGSVVGSATALARIAMIVTQVGTAATTIADIIEDSDSAPYAILGLILSSGPGGGGRLTRQDALGRSAAARRLMKEGDLSKFTDSFKAKDALVKKISQKPTTCKA